MGRRFFNHENESGPGSSIDLGLHDLIDPNEKENHTAEEGAEESARSEFEVLAEEEKWTEIAALSEKSISGKSPGIDAEAKLWWIMSQLHLAQVPVSILAAPLDLIRRDLEERRLRGDDGAQQQRLESLVNRLIVAFIPRLKEAGDSRMAELFEKIAPSPVENEVMEEPQDFPAHEIESAAGEPEKKNRRSMTDAERLRTELGITHESPSSEMDHWIASNADTDDDSFWKKPFLIGLAIVIFLIVGVWWYTHWTQKYRLSAAAETSPPVLVASSRSIDLVAPTASAIEDVNTLSSLIYSIDGKNGGSDQQKSPETSGQASAVQKTEVPHEKERVNTESPREPSPRLPRVERDPLWGDLKREERSPFGDEENRGGIPVDKFSRPVMFRVVNETLVLPTPSLRAKPVQRLRAGDEVLVEAKMGPWLRLRSQSNRPGFILAQDAEEK